MIWLFTNSLPTIYSIGILLWYVRAYTDTHITNGKEEKVSQTSRPVGGISLKGLRRWTRMGQIPRRLTKQMATLGKQTVKLLGQNTAAISAIG